MNGVHLSGARLSARRPVRIPTGWPAIDEAPRRAQPGRAGVGDADPGRGRDGRAGRPPAAGLQPEGRRRVAQVGARSSAVDAERGGDQPGPAGEAAVREALEPAPRGSPGVGPCRRVACRARPAGAHRVGPSSGSTARISTAAGAPVGLSDHVQAVVHPVDKVHVGDARRPEHDRVAGRPPEAGVRGEVLRRRCRPRPRRCARPGARSSSSRTRRAPSRRGRLEAWRPARSAR